MALRVLWPDYDVIDPDNENNNSVVLSLTLGTVSFVFTGDAEADIWGPISQRLPDGLAVFQVPHHGGRNGVFSGAGTTPWVDRIADMQPSPTLALSCHIRPHGHPHPDVVGEMASRNLTVYRTDEHYHVSFSTNGSDVDVTYSHL